MGGLSSRGFFTILKNQVTYFYHARKKEKKQGGTKREKVTSL